MAGQSQYISEGTNDTTYQTLLWEFGNENSHSNNWPVVEFDPVWISTNCMKPACPREQYKPSRLQKQSHSFYLGTLRAMH